MEEDTVAMNNTVPDNTGAKSLHESGGLSPHLAAAAGDESEIILQVPTRNFSQSSDSDTEAPSNPKRSNLFTSTHGITSAMAVLRRSNTTSTRPNVDPKPLFKTMDRIQLHLASGPKWMWVRRCTITLFWFIWIGLLVAALVNIVRTPECTPTPKLRWWQKGPMYRIAVQSFLDTNGDGYGDLLGIQREINYIIKLNVAAIIIGPIHMTSRNMTNTSDLKSVDRSFGNINEFKPLLKTAARYGIKIILDLTPNPEGVEQHIWSEIDFNDSQMQNNILSDFRFWLRKGVDGILVRLSTVNLEKNLAIELLKEWKDLARIYSTSAKKRVFIIATDKEETDHLVSVLKHVRGNMIFIYYLTEMITSPSVKHRASLLDDYYHKMENAWCGFIFGLEHISSVVPKEQQGIQDRLFIILLFSMPGTPFIYYGDEIGLKDYKTSAHPLMRWDNSKYAGFTKHLPWITPDLDTYTRTVLQQSEEPLSTLSFYRGLGKIRTEEPSLQHGDFNIVTNTTSLLAYIRQWDQTGILIVLNFGGTVTMDFTGVYLPPSALLLAKSTDLSQCQLIYLSNMVVEANIGYILKYFISA